MERSSNSSRRFLPNFSSSVSRDLSTPSSSISSQNCIDGHFSCKPQHAMSAAAPSEPPLSASSLTVKQKKRSSKDKSGTPSPRPSKSARLDHEDGADDSMDVLEKGTDGQPRDPMEALEDGAMPKVEDEYEVQAEREVEAAKDFADVTAPGQEAKLKLVHQVSQIQKAGL